MHLTAEEAFRDDAGNGSIPMGRSASFKCPHCAAFTQQSWGVANNLTVYLGQSTVAGRQSGGEVVFAMALCSACKNESVFADGQLVYPASVDAPEPAGDLPPEIAADFQEARLIYQTSPRGAAALLRLTIQKLCPLIGARSSDINGAIGELVSKGTIPTAVQQALDSVRVIGNEAVHPGTMDLKDDRETAKSLFGLVNFIVEKAITEPKQIAAIYSGLPAGKLAGIAQRDAKKP